MENSIEIIESIKNLEIDLTDLDHVDSNHYPIYPKITEATKIVNLYLSMNNDGQLESIVSEYSSIAFSKINSYKLFCIILLFNQMILLLDDAVEKSQLGI